jgi:hypothetical protein
MVSEMLYDGHSNLFSQNQEPDEDNPEEVKDDGANEERKNEDGDLDDDDEDDLEDLRQTGRYQNLLKIFKVLAPDEVDDMIK